MLNGALPARPRARFGLLTAPSTHSFRVIDGFRARRILPSAPSTDHRESSSANLLHKTLLGRSPVPDHPVVNELASLDTRFDPYNYETAEFTTGGQCDEKALVGRIGATAIRVMGNSSRR